MNKEEDELEEVQLDAQMSSDLNSDQYHNSESYEEVNTVKLATPNMAGKHVFKMIIVMLYVEHVYVLCH